MAAMSVDDLQFQTAEVRDDRKKCTFCLQPVGETFYQVQGADACPACAELRKAHQHIPDPGLLRPILYGSAAALLGLIVWSTIAISTGKSYGFVAIGVGWLVGRAVRKGTNGHASRRYQILAVILTYLAIAGSFVPQLIAHMNSKEGQAQMAEAAKNAPAVSDNDAPLMRLGIALATMVGLSMVSPVLGIFEDFRTGIIGLGIVLFALHQAWQSTRPDEDVIIGPFRVEEPAP